MQYNAHVQPMTSAPNNTAVMIIRIAAIIRIEIVYLKFESSFYSAKNVIRNRIVFMIGYQHGIHV